MDKIKEANEKLMEKQKQIMVDRDALTKRIDTLKDELAKQDVSYFISTIILNSFLDDWLLIVDPFDMAFSRVPFAMAYGPYITPASLVFLFAVYSFLS